MTAGAILNKIQVLSQRRSLRHGITLFWGKAGVFLIAFLSQPILARMYSPAQFGEFAFFNGILAILLIAACGRYEAAIVLTKKPLYAGRLFQLSLTVLLGYVLVLSGVLLFFHEPIKNFLIAQGITSSLIWLIPLLIFFSGYWQIVQAWLIRFRKFGSVSILLFTQRLLIFLAAIALFYYPIGNNGLIFSLIFGSSALFILSLLFRKRQVYKFSVKQFKTYAYHFRDFPLFSVPTLFINMLLLHLPVVWITVFFNKEVAGVFSLAFAIVMLPVQMLHFSIGEVFYQRLAQINKDLRLALFKKYCLIYTLVLAPIVFLTSFFGEQFTIFFLGPDWGETGSMVQAFSLFMLIQGIYSLLMCIINVVRKQKIGLTLKLAQLLLWTLALAIGLYFQDILLSLKLIVFFSALHLAFSFHRIINFIIISNDPYSNRTLAK